MITANYDNRKLADDYAKCICPYMADIKRNLDIYNKVKDSKDNIIEIFKNKGSLKSLEIDGLKETDKKRLELILKYGPKTTETIMSNKKSGLFCEIQKDSDELDNFLVNSKDSEEVYIAGMLEGNYD